MKAGRLKWVLICVTLLSGMAVRAQQADDSLLIESEEALARSHTIQMDTAELARKNTEVELETKQAIAEAKKGIIQAKSDEARYAQLATKYEKSISMQRAQVERNKNEEKLAAQKVATADKKMKESERVKNNLTASIEKQKAKNEELKTKLASLNTRNNDLLKEIRSLQRQAESQKQKKQIYKNRIASLGTQVNKLNTKRSVIARIVK